MAVHPVGLHEHCVSRSRPSRRALIAMALVSMASLSTDGLSQGDSSSFVKPDPPSQNTVSTNQLLTPKKALEEAQNARKHLFAGHIDQAEKDIAHALEISPHCALALTIQGAIHIDTRQFEEAGEDFQDAIEADPSLGPAYLGVAMSLMGRGRFHDALVPLGRATSLLPGSWLVYYEEAITHLGLGDADAALRQITVAERFTGRDHEKKSGTAYVRGVAYTDLRDYDRAKKHFEDAIAFEPNGFFSTLARRRLEQLRALSIKGN